MEAHARLEHSVPFNDSVFLRIKARPIQRMSQRSGHAPSCVSGHLRVGVERDDQLHVAKYGRVVTNDRITGVTSTSDQPVEFRKLAALSLPAHPFALGFVPNSFSMEEEEPWSPASRVPRI